MEYGCIGEHLSHSFSKEIHERLADYDYIIKEIPKDELNSFMSEHSFKAINVTIPYKKDVIPFLDYISDEAEAIGAVNTIVNNNGALYGYNTDFFGMKSLIEYNGITLLNKSVAVIGSGGTSNTASAVAKALGAKAVIKVSRTKKSKYITYDELYSDYSNIDVIINTTPCGMYPNIGGSAVDIKKFTNLSAVVDAVYNPLRSQLVSDARKAGIKAVGGLYMLVAQAAFACEKFTGSYIDSGKIEAVYKEIFKSKENIVLIGMPASGKSTVGELLKNKTGMSFTDTDTLITENEGRTIPEIFKANGEAYFRNAETEAVLTASKLNNTIIATGGGAVLNERNTELLKQNGRVYFLDRPLSKLTATDDRPLSDDREKLQKLYNERYKLYVNAADKIIDASKSLFEVQKEIEDDFYENSCY